VQQSNFRHSVKSAQWYGQPFQVESGQPDTLMLTRRMEEPCSDGLHGTPTGCCFTGWSATLQKIHIKRRLVHKPNGRPLLIACWAGAQPVRPRSLIRNGCTSQPTSIVNRHN
jgi:hypothetical protein